MRFQINHHFYDETVLQTHPFKVTINEIVPYNIRYTLYVVSREALEGGAWRGRAALVAVAGCVGRAAPLLLAHLLAGGRLLALCSDLLHTVLPYYKTAEVCVKMLLVALGLLAAVSITANYLTIT